MNSAHLFIEELRGKLRDLETTNRVKDHFIERLAKDREAFWRRATTLCVATHGAQSKGGRAGSSAPATGCTCFEERRVRKGSEALGLMRGTWKGNTMTIQSFSKETGERQQRSCHSQ